MDPFVNPKGLLCSTKACTRVGGPVVDAREEAWGQSEGKRGRHDHVPLPSPFPLDI